MHVVERARKARRADDVDDGIARAFACCGQRIGCLPAVVWVEVVVPSDEINTIFDPLITGCIGNLIDFRMTPTKGFARRGSTITCRKPLTNQSPKHKGNLSLLKAPVGVQAAWRAPCFMLIHVASTKPVMAVPSNDGRCSATFRPSHTLSVAL